MQVTNNGNHCGTDRFDVLICESLAQECKQEQ
jgi:hypothetical protein